MRRLWDRAAPSLGFTLGVLLLWEGVVIAFKVPDLLLPAPSDVIAAMLAGAPKYLRYMMPTLVETLLGYGIALVIGALCGVLIAFSRLAGRAIYPALIATQIMPKVAFAPLLVVWFGFGMAPKLILIALIAFFPIVINTVIALNMTSQETIYLFRSMGAGALQTFFKLRLPNALPVFFGGLKVAATLSVIGVVVAEFYSSDKGLGYLLLQQVSMGDTTGAFASIAYVTIMGLLIFAAIVGIERVIVPAHMLKRFDETAGRTLA
jgi:NitT/TauT family transport system permease protein